MSGASNRSMVLGVLCAAAAVFVGVGGGHAAPICRAAVTIRRSTDGGAAFPDLLGSFANTGVAPRVTVTSGRVIHSLHFL
jgi:hypothetical protein